MGEKDSKSGVLVLIWIDQMRCDLAEFIWRVPSGWLHCVLEADKAGRDGMLAPPNEQSLSEKYLGCYEIGFQYRTSIWCNSKSLFIHPNLELSEALSGGRRISRFCTTVRRGGNSQSKH